MVSPQCFSVSSPRLFQKSKCIPDLGFPESLPPHCFGFFWLCWVFVAVCRLSPVAARGLLIMVASQLWSMSSRCLGFRSCGMWAQQLHQHLFLIIKIPLRCLGEFLSPAAKLLNFILKTTTTLGSCHIGKVIIYYDKNKTVD